MAPISPESACLSSAPWLAIVGIGEDGRAGLSAAAQAAIDEADFVVGGARHLALAAPLRAETLAWPSPIADGFAAILARRGRKTCVLASGDPFHYGVGVQLAKLVPAAEMAVHPQPSSFALACARLGWAQQDCELVSLHGRALERILPHLQPGARILALSWDGSTPAQLAALLGERGFGASALHVLEALGGPRERVRSAVARGFAIETIDPLNLVAIEVAGDCHGALPLAAGLDDERFAHEGQITKAEIRAITLAALSPLAGELVWDIGAGSGSISAEWCLRHPRNRAIAFEEKAGRLGLIESNRRALGALPIAIVAGRAPASLNGQPAPDAVFIGGGITEPGLFEAALAALKESGRLVANVVTLEGEARLAELHARHGGTMRRIAVSRLDAIGGFHGWRPAMPVTQWRMVRR